MGAAGSGHGFFDSAGCDEVGFDFFEDFGKHGVDLTDLRNHDVGNGCVGSFATFGHEVGRIIVFDAILPGRNCSRIVRCPCFEVALTKKVTIVFKELANGATGHPEQFDTHFG